MGCLKLECRQIDSQRQDDSRDFPEEEHQFEMALRIRSWLRGLIQNGACTIWYKITESTKSQFTSFQGKQVNDSELKKSF